MTTYKAQSFYADTKLQTLDPDRQRRSLPTAIKFLLLFLQYFTVPRNALQLASLEIVVATSLNFQAG